MTGHRAPRPDGRSVPWLVWSSVAIGVGMIGVLMWSQVRDEALSLVDTAGYAVMVMAFLISGAVIVSKQPRNVIGWLLMVPGLAVPSSEVVRSWLVRLGPEPERIDPLLWLSLWFNEWAWILLIFPIFLIVLTLPDGRLLSPRWRWLMWLIALMIVISIGFVAFAEELVVRDDRDVTVWSLPNPIGFISNSNIFNRVFSTVWGPLLVVVTVAGVVAFLLRYRRGSGEQRRQLKWPLLGVALFGIGYGSLPVVENAAGSTFDVLVFPLALAGIPVSVAIAVVKYRLYEIDRIVSRTVSYAVVVGLSAALFFGGVTALSSLLPGESDLAVAGSTLAVAAVFNPLRRRVQNWVDRRFNRSRYDTARVMDGFAGSLRDRVDPDRVIDDWVGVVSETMQPSTIAVWTPGAVATRGRVS